MTTAVLISELLPLHDDALIADIDHIFDEIDRTVRPTAPEDTYELLLVVDELVDELLTDRVDEPEREKLTIELELDLGVGEASGDEQRDEVAEVA